MTIEPDKMNVEGWSPPADHVEVLAYLQDASDDSVLRLRDLDGTWVVRREDVVELSEWSGADVELSGKPVKARVRAGSSVELVKTITVLPTDTPLTFPSGEEPPRVVGAEELSVMGRRWAGKLGFTPGDASLGGLRSSTTACCWESGEWATDCSPDDCG